MPSSVLLRGRASLDPRLAGETLVPTTDGALLFFPRACVHSASEPGTIRGDFCIEVGRNVIHGSDAVESAKHEIGLWFPEGVTSYEHAMHKWTYE